MRLERSVVVGRVVQGRVVTTLGTLGRPGNDTDGTARLLQDLLLGPLGLLGLLLGQDVLR